MRSRIALCRACAFALAAAVVDLHAGEDRRVSERIDDFATTEAWDSTRGDSRLKKEFHHYTFSSDASAGREGKGMRWRFQTRKQGYSDVYTRRNFAEPFDRVALWVRNPARKPLMFWIKLVEADGSDFAPKPLGVPLDGTAEWQRIEFRLNDYKVASWSKDENDRLDFPLKAFALVAYKVRPGEDYELHFDDLEVSRPGPERIRSASVEGPQSIAAGETAEVRIALVAEEKLRDDYDLSISLEREGKTVQTRTIRPAQPTSGWPVGKAIKLPVARFRIGRFASGGRYSVHAQLGWTRLVDPTTGSKALLEFQVKARETGKLPTAEVRPHNGVPTLFLNGQPNAGMTYMTYNRQETKHFAAFGQIGVNLASFSATSDFSFYNLAPPTWLGPDEFDYSAFDKRIVEVLEANPNAYIFPRVYMSAPPWWSKAHPDEAVRQHDGAIWNASRPVGSWASDKWRADAGQALARFISHVRKSPYADRVIGYHIACGHTEEWFWWGFWARDFLDYSEPNRRRFAQWLQRKYAGAPASVGEVQIPTKQQRTTADLGCLRDPGKSQRVVDFNDYHNDLVVDTIEHFARLVKHETQGTQLCGLFYGYIFELNGSPEGGHNALARLLRCADVDFLTAPSSYNFRQPGSGYSVFMSATESIKLHGKLWVDENDYRTHLLKPSRRGQTKDLAETIQVQRRELANVLCHGTAKWWFDMGGGWYDEPAFMEAIGQMNRIAERSIESDRSSIAEVALVVDERSMSYTQDRCPLGRLALSRQRLGFGHMGAPYDTILLDDLELARPYKVYVFVNAYHVSPQQREAIERRVKCEGRTAVWVYAPGVAGESLSTAGVEALTGIRVAYEDRGAALKVAISNVADPITQRLKPGASWGAADAIAPIFYSVDPAATVLGNLQGIDKPGLVVRRFDDWTSVYSAAPNLPSWLLREIARDAGVHVFSDRDEALYANRSLLAIHTAEAGPRRLRFPKATPVYDLFADKQLAERAVEMVVDLPAHTTGLYFLGRIGVE